MSLSILFDPTAQTYGHLNNLRCVFVYSIGETPAAVQHSVANQISHIYVTLQALASLLIVLYISC